MKVTGYKLRDAIKQWELKKAALERLFASSLQAFASEKKADPRDVLDHIALAEESIAQLQYQQTVYNAQVTVHSHRIPLAYAIKRLGVLSRVEKHWREAGDVKESSYYTASERDPAKEYARQVIPPAESMEKSLAAARLTSDLRSAIASANGTEVDLDIGSALFI